MNDTFTAMPDQRKVTDFLYIYYQKCIPLKLCIMTLSCLSASTIYKSIFWCQFLRCVLTDIFQIPFIFNVGQSPAYIFSLICIQLIHCNRMNHERYSVPSFPAPQLYLLRHTLTLPTHILPSVQVSLAYLRNPTVPS